MFKPSDQQMEVLEDFIFKTASRSIPNFSNRDTYGDRIGDRWSPKQKIRKFFPLKIELGGRELSWDFEMIVDESLIGHINLVSFCHYTVQAKEWLCVMKYWEVHPGMFMDAMSTEKFVDREWLATGRKFVTFSGNHGTFENDLILMRIL